MATKFCLINNGNHIGISCIGRAYAKAFENLGLNFTFLDWRSFPKMHNDTINMTIKAHLATTPYTHIVFIQPTYLYADTYMFLMGLKKQTKTKFFSIHTEDPYSVAPMLQMAGLFDMLFTNEITCAKQYENQRFYYLPVAHDHWQQYKPGEKEYDASMICSFYENRIPVYEHLRAMPIKKFISGNIAYIADKGMSMDLTGLSQAVGLMPRHKELEIYSKSVVVLNPHRPPHVTGRYDFSVPGKICPAIMESAYSPNPRFFDALCCGAYPLNDVDRFECQKLLEEVTPENLREEVLFCLPADGSIEFLPTFVKTIESHKEGWMASVQDYFLKHHTYFSRALEFLGVIDA